jgi:phosphocarrier protein
MKQFCFTVRDPNGIHARPAGALSAFVKGLGCEVRIRNGEKEADAKRLLSVMALGARCGTMLTVTVSGDEEEKVSHALQEFCEQQLGQTEAPED